MTVTCLTDRVPPVYARAQLKNVTWGTYTCTFGWAVAGAWPDYGAANAAKVRARAGNATGNATVTAA